ncbi:hypothetical protein J6590_009215 [Homalodisca vitripennis]|nr:hypothetical protein J6590_009215 [Homalodisca vitripennis]
MVMFSRTSRDRLYGGIDRNDNLSTFLPRFLPYTVYNARCENSNPALKCKHNERVLDDVELVVLSGLILDVDE